jgi:hypothetical protein
VVIHKYNVLYNARQYSNFIGRNFVVARSIYNGLAGWVGEKPPLCSIELPRRATALYSMGWSIEVGLRPLNAATHVDPVQCRLNQTAKDVSTLRL